jgi:hypothetical protein
MLLQWQSSNSWIMNEKMLSFPTLETLASTANNAILRPTRTWRMSPLSSHDVRQVPIKMSASRKTEVFSSSLIASENLTA